MKNIYTVIMKQHNIFVLDKCEIKVYKKIILKPHVDLHKLRKSNSVRLCPVLPTLNTI